MHSWGVVQPEFDSKQSNVKTDIHNYQIMNLIVDVLDFKWKYAEDSGGYRIRQGQVWAQSC